MNSKVLGVTAVLLILLICTFFYANYFAVQINYFPLNGSFQSFNAVQRIFAGEVIGRDFSAYIGLGPTYIIALSTWLAGQDFSASMFATHAIHIGCHFLMLLVLIYLVRAKFRWSVLAAATLTCFVLINHTYLPPTSLPPAWITASTPTIFDQLSHPFIGNDIFYPVPYPLYNWRELSAPGHSNLGLRGLLPFISCGIILITYNLLHFRKHKLYVILAILIGLQIIWSNDYGLPSTLALTAIAIAYIFKHEPTHGQKLKQSLLLLIYSSLSFLTFTSLVTLQSPIAWWQKNLGGVASDQYWYYLNIHFGKVFALNSQVFAHPYILISALVLLYFTGRTIFQIQTPHINSYLLAYLGLTCLGAGLISCIGGYVSIRYYSYFILVAYFILWATFKDLIIHAYKFSSRHTKQFNLISPSTLRRTLSLLAYFSIASICLICLYTTQTWWQATFTIPSNDQYAYSQELGGWLPKPHHAMLTASQKLQANTTGLPPEKRLLSTYASGIDTIVGSSNSTHIDYIIHALGDTTRQQYLDAYRTNKPQYITTLRHDFTPWERWVRRTNWWLYREFINEYEIIDLTTHHLIWQQRPQPVSPPNLQVTCQIEPITSHQVELQVQVLNPPQTSTTQTTNALDQEMVYLDLGLDYHTIIPSNGHPIVGKRALVQALDLTAPPGIPLPYLLPALYGLPPTHTNWHIPLRARVDQTAVVELIAYPEDRATLIVDRCDASVLTADAALEVRKVTTPAAFSDVNWSNGILTQPNATGNVPAILLIHDAALMSLIHPGTQVEFAHSGQRTVIATAGDQLIVSGPALDPTTDGYPNPVTVRLR